MIPNGPREVFCEDTEEAAAIGLLALMTGISEEFWCASWLIDLEYSLWDATTDTKFGRRTITKRQATLLRLLSEECDGWWRYDRDHGEPVFISRSDWQEHVAARAHAAPKPG